PEATGHRIQRRKNFVLGQAGRACESIEQGRFTGVGVADDRCERPVAALPSVTLGSALSANNVQFFGDPRDSILNATAVRFELRFTVTPHTDATFLPRQVAPEAR